MLIAGAVIVAAFFVFALFSLLLIAPGMLLYNAGIKSIFNNMPSENSYMDDGVKTIDVTYKAPENDFVNKGKMLLKSVIKKIRNFLNKYAD